MGDHLAGSAALPRPKQSRGVALRARRRQAAEATQLPVDVAPVNAALLERGGREAEFQNLPREHRSPAGSYRGRDIEPGARRALPRAQR